MGCQYRVKEEEILYEGEVYPAYGIEAVLEGGAVAAHLPALFADRPRAEALAERCNRLSLSPCHLAEVGEDILAK